jgi:hypothetical protein
LNRKEIEDETSWWNLRVPVATPFISPSSGPVRTSAWFDYPSKYRFMGVQVFMSADKVLISRETEDLFDFLGEIGGLLSVFVFIGNFICLRFASFKILASITAKLFGHHKGGLVATPSSSLVFFNRCCCWLGKPCQTASYRAYRDGTRGVLNSF